MDVLTDDQSLQGVLDRELGLDNPGLDLPSDLEDIIFKGDGTMCLPDDAVALGFGSNSAYSTGSSNSCSLAHHNPTGQGHGHLGDPQAHRQLNGLADQLSQQLQHQQQLQQYQQHHQDHQQQQQQQQQQLHHSHHNNSCEHQQRQAHLHLQHQQQQQQQSSSYCSISGQPQLFDGYDHPHIGHTSLPDSPPDSGSEPPYSPDGNLHHQTMTDLKSTIPGSLPTLPQSMYLGHSNRLGGMPPTKAPPAYIPEPPKLNHHHQGPPQPQLQQQQQQQHQQNQRVPMPYPSGVAMGQHLPPHQISPPLTHPILPAHMGSMSNISNQVNKKRKFSDSPTGTLNPGMMHGMNGVLSIKQEPPGAQFSSYIGDCSGGDDDLPPYDIDSNGAFIDSTYQVIKWQLYNQSQWAILTDGDLKDLPTPQYRVDADKGFNFSVPDEAFVCQKKNHFQVTVHMRLHGNAKYIRTVEGVKKIESFYLHFYGVKMESQNQVIKIEQSQSDRSKKSFHPVKVDLPADQETKVTVGRLHFSETTSNNMRKKGKPNPDQRYFLLVVSLHAHSGDKDYMLVGNVSDRIIVRASNPGQFDNDVDVMWQKGQTNESVYHMGRVGINTEHPEEALTVHGNMRLTGHLTQPSDKRVKENIEEIDPKNQLENVSKLRIYRYTYREEYADHTGIPNREDTGVLAQEILDVLPDAVQETGDVTLSNGETIENLLVVNKDRIFMENVGAVKELCKLTDNLEVRIDQLEKMNRRLGKLKRFDSLKSTTSTLSIKSISTISTASSVAPKQSSGSIDRSLKTSSGRTGHHSSSGSMRSSHGKSNSLNSSKSTLTSLLSRPIRSIGNHWFRYIVIGLILLMAFCVAALACLYILEVQKPDGSDPVVADTGPVGSTNRTTGFDTTSKPTRPDKGPTNNSEVVSTPSSTPVTTTTTSTTTSTVTSTRRVTPVRPGSWPVMPPYPQCSEGYCETYCCPPPHEDQPDVIIYPGHDGENPPYENVDNQSEQKGEEIEYPNAGEDVKQPQSTKHPQVETVVVNLPPGSTNINHNHDNTMLSNTPKYSVINQMDNPGMNGIYTYRRRRGAEDAPRPTIRIVELNYILSDSLCDTCQGNNFTYYVLYNSSFAYEPITVEFRTPTMSYMRICNATFMWNCPPPALQDREVSYDLQQTNIARWTVNIGNHFRTILSFVVVHSIKGYSVMENQICSLQNNDTYVVMRYTILFQRQC